MAIVMRTTPHMTCTGGYAIVVMPDGRTLRTGEIIALEADFHGGVAREERPEFAGTYNEIEAPAVELRLIAKASDTGSDLLTESAALADQLEQAGNDWGAGVVRRLAGITLVEPQPSANPGR